MNPNAGRECASGQTVLGAYQRAVRAAQANKGDAMEAAGDVVLADGAVMEVEVVVRWTGETNSDNNANYDTSTRGR